MDLFILLSLLMAVLAGLCAVAGPSRQGRVNDSRASGAGCGVRGAAAERAAPARAQDRHFSASTAGTWATPACGRGAACGRVRQGLRHAETIGRIFRPCEGENDGAAGTPLVMRPSHTALVP